MPEAEHTEAYSRLIEAIQTRDNSLNDAYGALLSRFREAEALLSGALEEAQKQRVSVVTVPDTLQTELEAVRAALATSGEAQAREEHLQRELMDRADALQAAQQRIAMLEHNAEERAKAAQAAQSLVDDLEQTLDEEKAARLEAEKRIEEAEAVLAQRAEAFRELEQRAEESIRSARELQAELDKARQETEELESRYAGQEGEREQAAKRISDLEKALAESADALQASKTHAEELEHTMDGHSELKERLEEAGLRLQEAEERAEAAETGARERAELADQAQSRLADAQAELETLQESSRTQSEELAALRTEIEDLRVKAGASERVAELRQLLDAERERANILEVRLKEEHARGTKATLAKQLADAIQDREEAYEELLAIREELARLRAGGDEDASPEPTAPPPLHEHTPKEPVRVPTPKRTSDGRKTRLGSILVQNGAITIEQLDEVLEEQERSPHRRLGELLVNKGYASEEEVGRALAVQCNSEFVSLQESAIDPAAVRLVSKRLAKQHACIPVTLTEDTLVLAMTNPLDLIAIEDVELATDRRVTPVVSTASEIDEAIQQAYPD